MENTTLESYERSLVVLFKTFRAVFTAIRNIFSVS